MAREVARPAYRLVHVCYCCADTAPVVAFFGEGLGLEAVMDMPVGSSSGAILGLPGDVISGTTFLYDSRGPRVSPAIEVQSWIDPPLAGTPPDDPTEAGIQALGFSVRDVAASVAQLASLGATVVAPFDQNWATVRDPRGVTLDLVEDPTLTTQAARLRHLRISCTDLPASLAWYEGLGFDVIAKSHAAGADTVRMRLSEEPFEIVLVGWIDPPAHGRHTAHPNSAGLYRAAVGVEDTNASYDAMTAAGWSFDRAPMRVELAGTPGPPMWICFLSDPDGVPFELVERPRSAFRPA